MTRISSFGQNQTILDGLLRNQQRVADLQNQVNTGKKASDFKGFAQQTVTLMGAKTLQVKNDQYTTATQSMKGVLDTYEVQLNTLDNFTKDLQTSILNGLGQNQIFGFAETLDQTFKTAVNALNTKVGNNYIFGGTRTDTAPVNISSVAALVAAPTTASVFSNNSTPPTVRVNDALNQTYGQLASDVGGPIMDVLKNLATFNAGASGPINGNLTPTQITFLQGQLTNLQTAVNQLRDSITENGLRQQRVTELQDEQSATKTFLATFISDIEDVDSAEAITNLNNDQTALQASYKIVSGLSDLSLLNFLK